MIYKKKEHKKDMFFANMLKKTKKVNIFLKKT